MFKRTGAFWFDAEVEDIHIAVLRHGNSPAFEGMLGGLVEQVYRTRGDFRDEMAALTTIIITTFTAGGVLLNQGVGQWGHAPARPILFFLLAGFVFGMIHPLGRLYKARLSAAYDIYVAACIHCVMYHLAFNLPLTHLWQRNVIECLKEAKGQFPLRRRADSSFNSWQWHRDFIPSRQGRSPMEYGELVQSWKERKPNLSTSLRNTILTARIIGTVMAMVCMVLVVLTIKAPATWIADSGDADKQRNTNVVQAESR